MYSPVATCKWSAIRIEYDGTCYKKIQVASSMLRAFESLGDMRGRCTTREPRKSRLYASCGVPFGVVCPIKDLPQALEGLLSTHKRVGGLATAWTPALPERGLPGMRLPGPGLPG